MHHNFDEFYSKLRPYFTDKYRDMPWRHLESNLEERFYRILVSEVMLQQTQVSRVIQKYEKWMDTFPNLKTLANASLSDVLALWQGLGYSRRAKYLHDAAKHFSNTSLPKSLGELTHLKGIGPNTAGAILVYTYDTPEIFIETNIRTVLFHHFFANQIKVPDTLLIKLMNELIDRSQPRTWYWAMMDYGNDLKKIVRNTTLSKHYKKQSKFEGSDRQKRANLLRKIINSPMNKNDAIKLVEGREDILNSLIRDGLVVESNGYYEVANT